MLTEKQADFDPSLETLILEFVWSVRKFQKIRGLWQEQIAWCKRGLIAVKFLQDTAEEMSLINNIGSCNEELGNTVLALENYNQAPLLLNNKDHHPAQKGVILNNIASAYLRLGEIHKSLKYFMQSLEIHNSAGPRQAIARVLSNIGQIYTHLGEWGKALEYLEQSLAVREEIGDAIGNAVTLNSIGKIYDSMGEFNRALDHYQNSLAIRHEKGDREGEVTVLINIGSIYGYWGKLEIAVDHYLDALINIGAAYNDLDDTEHALQYFEEVLLIYQLSSISMLRPRH